MSLTILNRALLLRFFRGLLLVAACVSGIAAAQESASGDHVKVRWLAPDTFGPGEETVGFYFEVDPGWHVYWRNAGDSGAAPRFDFAGASGELGEIQWPFPVRLPIEHLTNLGYEGDVAYLFSAKPDASRMEIVVSLEWLVCKVDCIPGYGNMTLSRPVAESAQWQPEDKALRDKFAARVPSSANVGDFPWTLRTVSAEPQADSLQLVLETEGGSNRPAPDVFPLDGGLLTARAPEVEQSGDTVRYTFQRVPGAAVTPTTGFVISDGTRAWQLDDVEVQAAATSAPDGRPVPVDSGQPLWLLVLAAIAGGAILNLMPCVFPVLSIKLFGLVGPEAEASGRLKEGLRYAAGVLVTFAALGALLLVLRAGGAAIGWGFQLQSAPVVLGLILLFWVMALSFSGLYEFGHHLMNLAGNSRGGAFVTGVLAVFVAAPCTGPFMGAALGAATLLPAWGAMAIFLGLGIGLALPFVLLCAFPALLNRLPAPGPWMETLRQFLAFPLYATVIWLLWVLGRLVGESGWVIGAMLMLTVVFAFWLGRHQFRGSRWIAWGLVLAALVMSFGAANKLQQNGNAAKGVQLQSETGWQPYDRNAISQALARKQAVFIDYTAAWCITCQVNKKLVLESEEVEAMFQKNNVYLVRADWTDQDREITRALGELGRNSVPVYAWYAPGEREPVLLPQILKADMIEALFTDE
ncbi:protein-disulfide reductase DsbD family protein [Microbulbifer hydrolyticus]|uniref:Glucan 1,4-alpha-glucosidase n=1 Tax=Microbulbifer hydrolyticus TaxID=48074 RepID=A0A6P1TA93_9GAMM|nr:thioredoxin family protein [Microbulbifer hydrolyticus]MBB5213227.1 thiol:disulfide interchange protein DsbD [Microbulbifer hydrolyticus]QHQ38510.1 glucan 1,4-alpha-glucosidase [Microbulbifer hydrolyticus]